MATSSRKSGEANDYSIEEKIIALYELQKIDSKIDEINKIKGELPLEVQDLEDEIAGLETRIANIASEIDGQTAAIKQYKNDIEQAKGLIAKYEAQQDNVRNNREFDSLSKEIEYQKLEIELCEKRIKESTADTKVKKKMIEDAQAVVADRKIDLAAKSKSWRASTKRRPKRWSHFRHSRMPLQPKSTPGCWLLTAESGTTYATDWQSLP